jgi:ABC-type nitrate/sulfonate/bicarbonate transport system substrate-binding protein
VLKKFGLVILAAGLLFRAQALAQEKRLQGLRLAYGAASSARIPYWLAKEAKLDQKYGIDLNLIFINGAPVTLNALVAGDIDMAATSGVAGISLAAQGGPIAIIANIGATPYKLVAHPSIKTIQGLRGKIIGTDRIGGATDFALQELLPQLGLLPGKDVQLIGTGLTSSAERVLLIHRGKIDATFAVLDNVLKMELQGYPVNILADLLEHGIYATGGDLMTSRQYLKQNRDTAKRFLKALCEAIWLGRQNKDLVLRVYRKYLKTQEAILLESLYKNYVLGTIQAKPFPEPKSMQRTIDVLAPSTPHLKGQKVGNFIDNSLLREIDKEGFFDRLYR